MTFLAYQKGSDQLLSHLLDSTSQASQLIGLIRPKKCSKCNNSLTVRECTKLSNLYFFGSYKLTHMTRADEKVGLELI